LFGNVPRLGAGAALGALVRRGRFVTGAGVDAVEAAGLFGFIPGNHDMNFD
jgi:hypothetical protein